MNPAPMLITDSFIHHAIKYPDQLAIHCDSSQYTYRELLQSIRQVADCIRVIHHETAPPSVRLLKHRLGVKQPCLALLVRNCPEFLELFLGTALAGGTTMVLNPDWTMNQIEDILTQWVPDIFVAEPSFWESRNFFESTNHKQFITALSSVTLNTVSDISFLKSQPLRNRTLKNRVKAPVSTVNDWCWNNQNRQNSSQAQENGIRAVQRPFNIGWSTSCTNQLGQHTGPDHHPTHQNHVPQAEHLPFYIGFTSGTTGKPKGVIRSHKSWVNSFRAGKAEFEFSMNEHILVPGSFVHSLSLYSAVEALANGATLHSLSNFSPKAILQRCQNFPITRLVAVPTILGAIAHAASRTSTICPDIRSVISGGSKLKPGLRRTLHMVFPNARLIEYYGASELSFISIAASDEAVPPHSVGRPFASVDVSIRRDNGSTAPPGETGWIGVRSNMVCSGYLEQSDDTGFRIEHGWATVGDRGWLDESGYLYLAGRERDMLISNGINVFPAEVESVLSNHPAVDDAVVFGIPDDCRGDVIYAALKLCKLEQSQIASAAKTDPCQKFLNKKTLKTYLRKHIEIEKCPRRYFIVREFPLNTSGKVSRLALKQHILNGVFQYEL